MILLTDDLGKACVLGSVRALIAASARASSVAISDGESRRSKFVRCQWFIANLRQYDLNAIRSHSALPVGVTIAA